MSAPDVGLPSLNVSGVARKLLVPGVVSLELAVVGWIFKLLSQLPAAASIELLKSFGPGFLLGILVVAVLGYLLSQVVDISRDGVAATRQMAESIGRIAEKDDRQIQEIQTLVTFTAQEARRTQEHLREVTRVMSGLSEKISGLKGEKDAAAARSGF